MKRVLVSTIVAVLCATFSFAQDGEIRVPNGYQGYIEEGNLFHFDGESSINLSTTHGFYFGGHTFAGIGLGAEFNNNYALVPFFTSIKYVVSNQKPISPFFSVRLGSYLGHDQGAYGDASLGVRFATTKDFALSIMVGATYYEKFVGDEIWDSSQDKYVPGETIDFSGLSVRFGIEW